jgi:HSP20 family protein
MVNLIPWGRRREHGDAGSLLDLRSEMDRLFDHFFETGFGTNRDASSGLSVMFTPAMDIYEEDNNFIASFEVPGMNPDDIEINVTGNTLTVSGEKKEESETRREGAYRSERRFGRFYRALELPDDVDAEKVSADYDNGVLKLCIPRSEARQPKRISVKAGAGASTGRKQVGGSQQQPGRQQGGQRTESSRDSSSAGPGRGSAAAGAETSPTSRGMSSQSTGQSGPSTRNPLR